MTDNNTINNTIDDNDDENIVLPLLPFETTPLMFDSQTGISSITWYKNDGGNLTDIEDQLRQRTKQILSKNPWLTGHLETIDGRIAIVHPKTIDVDTHAEKILTVTNTTQLSKSMGYNDLSAAVDPFLAKSGGAILASNGTEPFWKVSLVVPEKEDDDRDLCLITSLSHAIGDGHTYYALHGMLSPDQPVATLNPERHPEITGKIETALGGPEHASALDIGFGSLFRLLRGALASKILGPPTIKVFEIPNEWIAKEKSHSHDTSGTEWVSTNDVVVSSFLNTLDADQAIMSVNFRGKLEQSANLRENDAGNYFQFLVVRPHDRETPARLRQAVNEIRKGNRQPKVMPLTSWEHLTSRRNLGMVSNWCSFSKKPLVLAGCSQTLHVPIVATDCLAMPWVLYGGLYIFRPDASDKVAAMFGGHPRVWKDLEASGMVGKELLGVGQQ